LKESGAIMIFIKSTKKEVKDYSSLISVMPF
jgi:hypothetical protein